MSYYITRIYIYCNLEINKLFVLVIDYKKESDENIYKPIIDSIYKNILMKFKCKIPDKNILNNYILYFYEAPDTYLTYYIFIDIIENFYNDNDKKEINLLKKYSIKYIYIL